MPRYLARVQLIEMLKQVMKIVQLIKMLKQVTKTVQIIEMLKQEMTIVQNSTYTANKKHEYPTMAEVFLYSSTR